MRILDLREAPEHIPRLAYWHHREWAHLYPDETEQDFARELQGCLGDGAVPGTFVALGPSLLGSASLLPADMATHPELGPWVASVYVRRACRGSGIGSALIRHVMTAAATAGLPELYLFTPTSTRFYARLGFQILARESYQSTPVTLMRASLY